MDAWHTLQQQAAAFRSAVLRADPDTPVPTCPEWDVRKLLRHLGRVYSMVDLALRLEPTEGRPNPPRMPEDFGAALSAWDERLAIVTTALSEVDPERGVWSFFEGGTPVSWTRRLLHETAIHRLDVEHAAAGEPPELAFDPELAADGVDEMLTLLLPIANWSTTDAEGRVLYHAADAGRTWLVHYRPREVPAVGSPPNAALGESEVDTTVAGTADAVYRRVWGRPSTAVVTGDKELAALAAGR